MRAALLLLPGLGLALLASLSVVLLNGGPLFYVDTGGYIQQGQGLLEAFGLVPPALETASSTPQAESYPAAPVGRGAKDGAEAAGIVGSRAIVYGLLVASGGAFFGYGLAMLPQLLAWLFIGFLTARMMIGAPDPWRVSLPLIAATLGALPFYAASLMPDLFAPILILVAALLTAWAERMGPLALVALLALGLVATVTHLTHLGLAFALIPASLLIRLLFLRQRWWLAPALLTLIALGGVAERAAFQIMAERFEKREVIYHPFLTARIIVDGPGMAYLDRICPKNTRVECTLHARLTGEANAERRHATRIIFAQDPDWGSYRLLPDAIQRDLALGQSRFLIDVALADPLGTLRAFLWNSWRQVTHVSIRQTLPDDRTLAQINSFVPDPPGILTEVAVLDWPRPLPLIGSLHEGVYIVSLLGILAGLIAGRGGAAGRVLVLTILAGILANAVICGGLSQPAPRYGARVAALLPYLAVLIWCLPRRGAPRNTNQKNPTVP